MARHVLPLAHVLRALVLAATLWMLAGHLTAVLLAGVLAVILHPLQRRLQPHLGRLGRLAPLLITTATLLLVLQAARSIQHFFSEDLGQLVVAVQGLLRRHQSEIGDRLNMSGAGVMRHLTTATQNLGVSAAAATSHLLRGVPDQVVSVFLFSVSVFFFLRDGPRLLTWSRLVLPFAARDIDDMFHRVGVTVRGAILGQIVTSAVQGTLTTVALYVFRVPGAFLFGVLATLLSVLPLFGTMPVTLGAVVYLLAVGRFGAALGMLVAAVVIGVSDNVVRPWTQSARTPMHPLLVLVSIFGGIDVFGASGVFLGPLLATLAQWVVDTYARRRALVQMPAAWQSPDATKPL